MNSNKKLQEIVPGEKIRVTKIDWKYTTNSNTSKTQLFHGLYAKDLSEIADKLENEANSASNELELLDKVESVFDTLDVLIPSKN